MTEEKEDRFTVRFKLIHDAAEFDQVKDWIEQDGYWIDSAQPLNGGLFYVLLKKIPDAEPWK